MGPLLEMDGIVAGYGGGDVLRGFDLSLDQGSFTCIVGPNGAGKSTVLKVASGLVRPTQGTITMAGVALTGSDPARILASGIVHVSQQSGLFPNLTVKENVLLGGYTLRSQKALVKRRYAEVAETIPLVADRERDRADNLSGGQRRVIEFARCLMTDPRVVLLDEPSLGLDPRALRDVYALIENMHRGGKTIVLVEQNVRLGLGVADYGVVMDGGRVHLTGDPADLLTNPAIAELYLGGSVRGVEAADAAEREGSPDRAAP